jgi:hypothetical protein
MLGLMKACYSPASILKNSYIVSQYNNIYQVVATFGTTKSFLSTTEGLALDKGLIISLNDSV